VKKVIAIIGARPQFIKHFPLEMACRDKIDLVTVHTGQHYDANMSAVFFDELGMSQPDYMLEIGSGAHGAQTGKMMISIEEVCQKEAPDYMLVYGDTNSTIAGALVAAKMHIPVIHVEAGLRSYNRKMPEEVNRVLTDHISDLLLLTSDVALQNLKREGIEDNVHIVGDIMKDLVLYCTARDLAVTPDYGEPFNYATIHRPYNTDDQGRLTYVLDHLNTQRHRTVFAIHPRTRHAMKRFGMAETDYPQITFIDPQGYLSNLGYLAAAAALITDSGGMQKEAYWTKTPCVTIRSETEWVETLEGGCNALVFDDLTEIKTVLDKQGLVWDDDLYGDGKAGEAIVELLLRHS
jgi:UDP-GlcNAc3NAcA epimerase